MNDQTREAVKAAAAEAGVTIEAEQEFGSFLSGAHKNANVGDSFPFKEGAAKPLTQEQKDFFNENGYLVIKGLLSQDKVDKYVNRLIDVCNGDVEPRKKYVGNERCNDCQRESANRQSSGENSKATRRSR